MFKVIHVLSLLSVLWISSVICENCLFTDQTWGDENPTRIVYCNSTTNTAEITNCRTGSGFKSNNTVSGCVNWEDWNDGCILRKSVPKVESCEGANSVSPQPVQGDPTSYYLCSSSSSKPIVLPCPKNRGFVSYEGYKGCVPWASWRNITGCTE